MQKKPLDPCEIAQDFSCDKFQTKAFKIHQYYLYFFLDGSSNQMSNGERNGKAVNVSGEPLNLLKGFDKISY